MPLVPIYRQAAKTSPLPVPQGRRQPEQRGQVAQGLIQGAQGILKGVAENQAKAQKLRLDSVQNDLEEEVIGEMSPVDGFLSKRGENAMEASDILYDRIDQAREKHGALLTNTRTREAYNAWADQRMVSLRRQVEGHVASEMESKRRFEAGRRQAILTSKIEFAASDKPERDIILQDMRDSAVASSMVGGLATADDAKEFGDAAYRAGVATVLDSLLGAEQYKKAIEFLNEDETKAALSQSQRAKYSRVVKRAKLKVDAEAKSDELATKHRDEETGRIDTVAANADLADLDDDLADLAGINLDREARKGERLHRAKVGGIKNAALVAYSEARKGQKGKPKKGLLKSLIPPKDYDYLDRHAPSVLKALEKKEAIARGRRKDDFGAFVFDSGDQKRMDEMVDQDLGEFKADWGPRLTERNLLRAIQVIAREKTRRAKPNSEASVELIVKQEGVISKVLKGGRSPKEMKDIRFVYDRVIDSGAKTPAEIRKEAKHWFGKVQVPGTIWGVNETSRIRATQKGQQIVDDEDEAPLLTPEERRATDPEREKARKALKGIYEVEPSEEEIDAHLRRFIDDNDRTGGT